MRAGADAKASINPAHTGEAGPSFRLIPIHGIGDQSSNNSLAGTFSPPASVSIASRDGFARPVSIRLM